MSVGGSLCGSWTQLKFTDWVPAAPKAGINTSIQLSCLTYSFIQSVRNSQCIITSGKKIQLSIPTTTLKSIFQFFFRFFFSFHSIFAAISVLFSLSLCKEIYVVTIAKAMAYESYMKIYCNIFDRYVYIVCNFQL